MDLQEQKLRECILEVLNNEEYKKNAEKAKNIIRSQPLSCLNRITYEVQNIVNFGGNHLKSSGQTLPVISYRMFDVVGLLLFMSLLVIAVTFNVIVSILKCTFK